MLEAGNEGGVADRSSDRLRAAQPVEFRVLFTRRQHRRDVRMPRDHRRSVGQAVAMFRIEPGVYARPSPIGGPLAQSCAHGVHRDIAQRGRCVIFVQRDATEPSLPEMPRPLEALVDMAGIPAMHRCQRSAQPVRVGRDQDKMDMVGHQHPPPNRDLRRGAVLDQKIAIQRIVGIVEKSLRTAVATLRDVVGQAGEDRTGKASHRTRVTRRKAESMRN